MVHTSDADEFDQRLETTQRKTRDDHKSTAAQTRNSPTHQFLPAATSAAGYPVATSRPRFTQLMGRYAAPPQSIQTPRTAAAARRGRESQLAQDIEGSGDCSATVEREVTGRDGDEPLPIQNPKLKPVSEGSTTAGRVIMRRRGDPTAETRA